MAKPEQVEVERSAAQCPRCGRSTESVRYTVPGGPTFLQPGETVLHCSSCRSRDEAVAFVRFGSAPGDPEFFKNLPAALRGALERAAAHVQHIVSQAADIGDIDMPLDKAERTAAAVTAQLTQTLAGDTPVRSYVLWSTIDKIDAVASMPIEQREDATKGVLETLSAAWPEFRFDATKLNVAVASWARGSSSPRDAKWKDVADFVESTGVGGQSASSLARMWRRWNGKPRKARSE